MHKAQLFPKDKSTDNILVAYEILHGFKKKISRLGNFALKLDMSKCYDRVEWDFVEKMMRKLGFCEKWIILIMRCIQSVSYFVVLNGERGVEFNPTRGLQQGDSLSPYLFYYDKDIPNHLFLADDNILFGRATMEGALAIRSIINTYEQILGQLVNFEKSLIYFSNNVHEGVKLQIKKSLGVRIANNLEKYLGLSMMVGRKKKNAFVEIKKKILNKSEILEHS